MQTYDWRLFTGTHFVAKTGSDVHIYVPQSLLDGYKQDEGWKDALGTAYINNIFQPIPL
jgi:hypothetical protein